MTIIQTFQKSELLLKEDFLMQVTQGILPETNPGYLSALMNSYILFGPPLLIPPEDLSKCVSKVWSVNIAGILLGIYAEVNTGISNAGPSEILSEYSKRTPGKVLPEAPPGATLRYTSPVGFWMLVIEITEKPEAFAQTSRRIGKKNTDIFASPERGEGFRGAAPKVKVSTTFPLQ